ncbi:hypothetical protein EUGRSUZ_L01005 [Eucalyptus grandis]|uniref:Uncharacterized protein n=1 Tax=Eucalyptus grandis TaxID=71139 RepID=A0A058ZVD5_EUCGR|nr:hypothetical protein EUGRSUZ_L01005 [Eucalyptus grandis]
MSDHAAIEIVELNDAAVGTDAAGTTEEEQFETVEAPPHAPPHAPAVGSPDDTVTRCLAQVKRLLQEAPGGSPAETSPHTIFRIPQPLRGIYPEAEEPEIVSIGPYHREQPQVLVFERLKPHFLKRFLHRTKSDLKGLAEFVAGEESSARSCYSEHVEMTSSDFVQMMLLDGCFVLELLLRFFESDATDEEDPIFARPQIIPILIRDLLKLENQIPYFLLHSLFKRAVPSNLIEERGSLAILALKLFNQAYPRPMALFKSWENLEGEHLLDLFYKSLSPARPKSTKESRSLAQSVPCVTELRPSRIYFESEKANSLLDISFRERILQIPEIAINDFMTTVLINCVSLDQCRENRSKYMTDYVSFMHCLINQPKDVSLLRSDGIIALYSRDDQYVADLFSKLGKSISFNVYDCFLSKQFEELESYYRSNWAKMMRTYFSCPWSVISLFPAILIVVLSIIQTFMAILAYLSPR